jgi:hypothetical protein
MVEHSIIVAHCIPLSNIVPHNGRDRAPPYVSMLLKPVTHSTKGRRKNALFKHKLVTSAWNYIPLPRLMKKRAKFSLPNHRGREMDGLFPVQNFKISLQWEKLTGALKRAVFCHNFIFPTVLCLRKGCFLTFQFSALDRKSSVLPKRAPFSYPPFLLAQMEPFSYLFPMSLSDHYLCSLPI